jgi:putative transposase
MGKKGTMRMPPRRIHKTVRQFNKEPIPERDMKKLIEIAEDYRTVKNYVYARYARRGGLLKIYPGYTVQNEMTKSGLRTQLKLPAVYFYLAVFDALGDIKNQWGQTRANVLRRVNQNENFTPEEKHYLRLLLRVNNFFQSVLNQKEPRGVPKEIQKQHNVLAGEVNAEKLCRYLRRQVRKHHVKPRAEQASGFSISERAYRYDNHGIYITTKEKRNRVFVLLTDNNQYTSQLYVKLFPEKRKIEIKAPIKIAVRRHEDYTNQVGLTMAMSTMLTTHEGCRYGENLGEYQGAYAKWVWEQTRNYNRSRTRNSGRKKYNAKKNRYEELLHSYINQELNRFLREEQPMIAFVARSQKPYVNDMNKDTSYLASMWQRGYIRKRLAQKCREHSIKLLEILEKNLDNICSNCGKMGNRKDGVFSCPNCGRSIEETVNTARNAWKQGMKRSLSH